MFLKGLDTEQKSAFYALAKDLASADKDFGESEKILMDQFLDEMEMTEADVEVMTAGAAIEIFMNSSVAVRKQVYIELVGLSLCDEDEHQNETKALHLVAENFGFSEDLEDRLKGCVNELLAVYQKIGELVAEEA